MSVYHRMLGRGLPCNVLGLLEIEAVPMAGAAHEALAAKQQRFPDVLYKLGLSHLARQEMGLARSRLSEAVAIKPKFVSARLALAAVLDFLAQHTEAAEQIEAALAIIGEDSKASNPSRGAMLCAAGFCLERSGHGTDAVKRYEQATTYPEAELFARYRLGAIALSSNQLEEASNQWKAILEHQPQEQGVRIALAHVLQMMGQHQEALWEYEKAICLEPDSWELKVEVVEHLALMGRNDEAIDQLEILVNTQPHFPDLRLRLANLYADRGDDSLAMEQYGRALSLHPDYLDCHVALARHDLRMGRMREALEHFQRAIQINDQNVEAYVGMAVAQDRSGEAQQAQETLAMAGKIAGNTDVLLVQLGVLEMQAEAAEAAENAFDPTMQSDTQSTETHQQHQWVEEQAKRYGAIVEERPSWTDVRVRYGMLLKLLGRHTEACEQFTKATQENSGYVEAWIQLGLTQQESGNAREAMQAFAAAVKLRPNWADLHYRLGLIYCSQMEFDLAMEQLEVASGLNPQNVEFQRQIWVALEEMQLLGPRTGPEMGVRMTPMTVESNQSVDSGGIE